MKNKYIISLVIVGLSTSLMVGQGKKVSVADVWKKAAFAPASTRGINSMNDGLHYTAFNRSANGSEIVKYSYKTGEAVTTLLSSEKIMETSGKRLNFDGYEFSPDESKVLLSTDTESIYRRSSMSRYYVYDFNTNSLDSLATDGKQQLASFSPTKNQVAFVKDNRLHIQDFDSGSRELISFGKGEEDAFIAGAVDWVYEEEFGFADGYQWSPGGSYIAYYQFDEREVPLFSMDLYGNALYPRESEFKYPKAGEKNSIVDIHLFDVANKQDVKVQLEEEYEYVPRIKWTKSDNELVIFTLNRLQSELTLWKVDAKKASAKKMFVEKAPSYLEIHDNLRFFSDGSFIWTSEMDGYNHIYHISSKGDVKKQITSGQWDVTSFYGIDENSGTLYYQSAEESPMQRAVYSVDLKGKSKKKLSTQKGWNSASFSDGFKYYINTYSNTSTPTYETLHDSEGREIRQLQTNQKLLDRLARYDLVEQEFFQFELEDGTALNGWMMKPLEFDDSKKYPVLMFVYGGPGSQKVKDQYDGFNNFYYQSLCANGYMVVCVDNRGTGARGRDFRTVTYKELGKYETEDQISAAKYLGGLDYIDSERIGIWGWSYGGYMSSLCFTKGAEYFKAAIAVAPVTNWRFYDNVYTERYMDLPQNNASGYDDNSPINHVDKLNGPFLLIHGGGDDNVHLQNTMRMVEALVQADKQFDLFIYPDKNHAIFGGNTRYHLYTKMSNFLFENL